MLKNIFGLILLLSASVGASVPSDTGSKEALKESAIRGTDIFTGKEFMVYESVTNDGYEQQKQFSKMKFFVAPLFRLIPDSKTKTVYKRTSYSNGSTIYFCN